MSGDSNEAGRPLSKYVRTAFGVAVLCALAGTSVGLLIVPRATAPPDENEVPPKASFLGRTLDLENDAEREMRARVRAYRERSFTLTLEGAPSVSLSLSKWGVSYDEERAQTLLEDLLNPASSWRRVLMGASNPSHAGDEASVALPLPLEFDTAEVFSELKRIKSGFDREPQDARIDRATKSPRAHQAGRWLDVDATLSRMQEALLLGELSAQAVIKTKPPKKTRESLSGLKFDTVLGHFETSYSRSEKYQDRTFNLRLAASKLDGTVLLPGEEFDFNDIVGARDEAAGYKVATVIADGELVDGIGGGTCQISGTLHGAVFFAGLEIVERYPHTRPSSYIKMGMDATVVYPTINFRFKNPYDFPVAVHQSVEDGTVHAEIRGPEVDQVVTLIRKVDQAIPYEQIERPDERMPRGTRALSQRGVPGFRLHRYRTIRRGSHTVRERWRDIYPPTTQVVRVGTGEASLPQAESVATPEYTADEVLILTMKRPKPGAPAEFAENRTRGKYGEEQWTREAGMPFWDGS